MKLKDLLKATPLKTNIGDFEFEEGPIGNGANSHVYLYKRVKTNNYNDNRLFAIKFLTALGNQKEARFIDEFFCIAQLDTHPNIVKMYHLDKVKIDENEFYIIIMKRYSCSLAKRRSELIKKDNILDQEIEIEAEKLQHNLLQALHFLHSNHIIHRDIKPENIFYDKDRENYVLGDFGIAFFDTDTFPKIANTANNERIANYLFSAPEQREKGRGKITYSSDIYALGQVLYWFKHGRTYQGTGEILDDFLNKCLSSDPANRFQSISEILAFIKSKQQPYIDYWKAIDHLDHVIRKTFPKISGLEISSDTTKINKFLEEFSNYKNLKDYWWMNEKGGDLDLKGLKYLSNNHWLFDLFYEIEIEKILIYRDPHHSTYKNFFIIIVKPSKPFPIVNENNELIKRDVTDWSEDAAHLWKERYIPTNETINGYYESNGEVIKVTENDFPTRYRHLKKAAYIIAPRGTGLDSVSRSVPATFLKQILEKNSCTLEEVENYIEKLTTDDDYRLAKEIAYNL